MNEIGNNSSSIKIFRFLYYILVLFLIFFMVYKWTTYKKPSTKDNDIVIIFKKHDFQMLKKLTDQKEDFSYNVLEEYLDIFSQRIVEEKIFWQAIVKDSFEKIEQIGGKSRQEFIKDKIKDIYNKKSYYLYWNFEPSKNVTLATKESIFKNFINVKAGINKDYIEHDKLTDSKYIKLALFINEKELKDIDSEELQICKSQDNTSPIDNSHYNEIIKDKDKNSEYLFVKSKFSNDSPLLKLFIDHNADALPIQLSSKLKWNYGFGWGYIWEVLIIFIGSLLFMFSDIFTSVGLGIILTTIVVRTLAWPVYTKTNTFSQSMNLMQPEIDKIKEKYGLKKDKESLQKMQIEIMKVYKKYNFNVFGIFIAFLQMPVFIAMFRVLKRFFVPGGIFYKKDIFKKPFLGFIHLDKQISTTPLSFWDYVIFIVLAFLVGITMFTLNRINTKKPSYMKLKQRTYDPEQQNKKKSQERTMKIVNYIMMFMMVCFSWQDIVLSLYWIVGNIYTIFQTILNNKKIQKKFQQSQKQVILI